MYCGIMNPVETALAAGAELIQVLIGTAVIGTLTLALLALGLAHRAGRTTLLVRAAAPLERVTGLPGWVVLPGLVSLIGFVAAGPGFVWDVALHVGQGRDAGPFANPSHFLLIVGTFSFIAAGWLAIVMPRGEEAGPRAVRLAPDWNAPAAGVAMLACGALSMGGFPLDDVWHQIFGQDVTLWGPTHLMMIMGGLLHFVAAALLVREGRLAAGLPADRRVLRLPRHTGLIGAGAVVLAGLTIAVQQEFGYGVPQFRLTFHPMLIALSAAVVLVPVRLVAGRGAALAIALVALALQAALTGIVVAIGDPALHFPPYLAEAVLVEMVALVLARRPAAFALACGLAIGTAGVAAEKVWSDLWMPLAWPAHMLPEAMGLGSAVAVAGGLVGVFVSRTLGDDAVAPPRLRSLAWALGAFLAALALLGSQLPTRDSGASVAVVLTEIAGDGARRAQATVRFDDPSVARDADWLYAMAWQGREHRVVAEPLRPGADGAWHTTQPLPVDGTWKSMIRLHRGSTMASAVVHLPEDRGIPAPAVPAPARFTRPLQGEGEILQRERKEGAGGTLWRAAAAAVALAVVALTALVLWTMLRLGSPPPPARVPPPHRRSRRSAAVGSPA